MNLRANVQEEYKKAKNHLKKSYIALADRDAVIPERKNLENLEPCIRSLKLKYGALIESVIIESTPTKTSYIEGEIVDLTGLKVTAVYTNGATRDVTLEVKCSLNNGDVIKLTDTTIDVEFEEGNVKLSEKIILNVAEYVPVLQYIEVTDPPKKTIYLVGNALDLNGMVVTATYGRGEKVDVTSNCTFNPVNKTSLTLSDNKIVISYTERGITRTTQIAISVENSDRTLAEIEIESLPLKTSYYTSEYFDPTGLKVMATFMGGEVQDVTEYCSFNPSYFETADITNVEIIYSENDVTLSKNVTVTVQESVIENIEVLELPKLNYFVGQSFDSNGLKVVANYNSGKQVDVTEDCTFTPSDNLKIEDEIITVSYLNFTTEINISVSKVEMSSIEVTKKPTKLVYYEGESVDLSGIEVTANFNNGSTMILSSGYTYSPEILSTSHSSVTITYQNLSTTYNITVLEPVICKIEITNPPTKTSYFRGDMIDTSGIKVIGTYTDGSTEDITSKCTFLPDESLTVDDTVITAEYEGFSDTTPISVTNFAPILIEITQKPSKTTYLVNESLDLNGLIAKITFNDGTSSQLLNGEGVVVTPTENLQTDNKTITVSYTFNGITVTTTFEIDVINASSTLSSNSWETIRMISESGSASKIWNVGDTKDVTIGSEVYTFRIIGFDHDDLVTPLANGRTKAGITFEMTTFTNATYKRYSTNFPSVPWASQLIYKTHLPAIFETIESDLKSLIKPVNKNTIINKAMTTDIHNLFVLSVLEYTNDTTYIASEYLDLSQMVGEGSQYDYYKAGNSFDKNGNCWLRSSSVASPTGTERVYSAMLKYGYFNSPTAQTTASLSLAFCI